jgi:diadenosine tetraphosphate (Ap4A) HIT family hydrolase
MSYDDDNIFAKILRGEIPCDKVLETDHTLAFNDITPLRPVHTLVIPKGRYRDFPAFANEATDEEIVDLVRSIGRVASERGIAKTGFRLLSNTGEDGHQEVPHLHVHIVGGAPTGPMMKKVEKL